MYTEKQWLLKHDVMTRKDILNPKTVTKLIRITVEEEKEEEEEDEGFTSIFRWLFGPCTGKYRLGRKRHMANIVYRLKRKMEEWHLICRVAKKTNKQKNIT